ncbi:hypothetical protein T484DRAFT_1952656 [Baffinella frigidus]|nr:hypothetical protein T484DRAFT_1952656 [Cryptophyta sp. CCMP2293]|mmetsp:Transcript_36008/g.85234  ORF Transcript_36008/g.85234 Transcript_36008/m.85234 type:complete len:138 (-) Transcript_36008:112-525(-)
MWGRRALLLVAAFLMFVSPASAGMKHKKGSSRRQTADNEMRLKRMDCERTVCAGLRDEMRTNCLYQCISQDCFNEVYAHDHVEEGEVDTERSRSFGVCFRRTFLKEQEIRMDRVRRENEERRAKLHDAASTAKASLA